ncbi:MAG TPA: efflux RND transporter periplasmic adaptor subunit [Verrucomicrobiota bacterium]|nr:efflux RND transporter periplasmic adaptor subunit [Verrucomicrobiota bacterium]
MKNPLKNLAGSLLLVALGAGGYALWQQLTLPSHSRAERKVLYYQDSMHPWIKSDQPGQCTICAMDLTPIYEGESGLGHTDDLVTLSASSVTVMNVQTDEVKRRSLHRAVRVAGVLEADTTRKTILAAPAAGRIDAVAVASAGVDVQAGQVLATIYSPDLVFQTRRYIFRDRITDKATQAAMMASTPGGSSRHTPVPGVGARDLPFAARERVEADPYFNDLLSTHTGTVTERNVFDGQYVAEGDRLFTIVDCSVLWFRFDVYEHQLAWLEPGQPVDVTVPSLPGQVFHATISVIEPTLNETTRTVKVRADVANPLVGNPGQPRRSLHLGMYAEGRLRAQIPDVLTIPRGALLFPGEHAYAYLDKGGGAYEMRRVTLGRPGDDHWEVLDGLEENDRVVISGNVLIDAQAQFNRSTVPGTPDPQPGGVNAAMAHADHASSNGTGHCCTESPDSPAPELTDVQHRALAAFLAVAHGISSTLAADDLDRLKPHVASLPALAQALTEAFPEDHPWHEVIQSLPATSRWAELTNLEVARRMFLPFSTNTVDLVQRLRSQETTFASAKVFFCPMAPKPGLWFQAEGPLRNPFYGSKMLTCGEEVSAPPRAAKATPALAAKPPRAATEHSQLAPAGLDPAVAPINADMHPQLPPAGGELAPAPTSASAAPNAAARRRGIAHYDQAAMAFGTRLAELSASLVNASAVPSSPPPAGNPELAAQRQQAIKGFLFVVDGMSQGLVADSVEQYRAHLGKLPGALATLGNAYPARDRVKALTRKLTTLAQSPPPHDLEDARTRFLALSSNAAELAKLLKTEASAVGGFKLYHCPMAPRPGVWLQAKGPLRNPFYGSKMLTCGEEVEP